MNESFKYDKRILKNPKLMESPLTSAEVDTYISELEEVQDQGILISELFAQREEAARLAEEEAARLAEEEAARLAEEEAARLAEEEAAHLAEEGEEGGEAVDNVIEDIEEPAATEEE